METSSSKAARQKAAMAPSTAVRTPLQETPMNRTGVASAAKPLPATPAFTLVGAATVDDAQDATTPEEAARTPMPATESTPAAGNGTTMQTPFTGASVASNATTIVATPSTQSNIFAKMRSWISRRAPQLANYTINETDDSCIGVYAQRDTHKRKDTPVCRACRVGSRSAHLPSRAVHSGEMHLQGPGNHARVQRAR